MNARDYFALLDAIANAPSATQLAAVGTRVADTDMHPFERLALERVVRRRALALDIDSETQRGKVTGSQ